MQHTLGLAWQINLAGICRCNETAISLKAACELFLRYTTRTSALESGDFQDAKARIIEVQHLRTRSALTTLIRARSSVLKSRLVCEDCLYAARKALTTLRALQESFSDDDASIDSYPYFLTWYVLTIGLYCRTLSTRSLL